jgi:hypothetical protein
METFVNELQSATDFVRQLFEDQQIHLDYSPQSVQLLDALFEKEFTKGELTNKAGIFAQYQGLIMTGVSGYVAQVILQNTHNAQLAFESDDENWFINFSIESDNGATIIPGHRVLKRAYNGDKDQLYGYVLAAINYFEEPGKAVNAGSDFNHLVGVKEVTVREEKEWWKIW